MLVLSIEFLTGIVWVGRVFLLEQFYNLLLLVDVNNFVLIDRLPVLVTLVLASTEVADILWNIGFVLLTDLIDGKLVGFFYLLSSCFVDLFLQQ